jgi:hypothetical protein
LAYGDGDEIEDMGDDDPALSEQRPTTTLPASHKKMIHSGTLYMAKVLTHCYISHATTSGSRVRRSAPARLVVFDLRSRSLFWDGESRHVTNIQSAAEHRPNQGTPRITAVLVRTLHVHKQASFLRAKLTTYPCGEELRPVPATTPAIRLVLLR